MDSRTRRTILRKSQTSNVNSVSESFFNFYQFNGINDSQNYATVDQNSFADANNMFVNTDDVLVTRPPVKEIELLSNILDTARDIPLVGDNTVYGSIGNGTYNGGSGNSSGTGTSSGDSYSAGSTVNGGNVILHIYNWLSTVYDYIENLYFTYTNDTGKSITSIPIEVDGIYQIEVPTDTLITIDGSLSGASSLMHVIFVIGRDYQNYNDITKTTDNGINGTIKIPASYGYAEALDFYLAPEYILDQRYSARINSETAPMHVIVQPHGIALNVGINDYVDIPAWQIMLTYSYMSNYYSYHTGYIASFCIMSNSISNMFDIGEYSIPRYIDAVISVTAHLTNSHTNLDKVHIGFAHTRDEAIQMALDGIDGDSISYTMKNKDILVTTDTDFVFYLVYFGAYVDDTIYLTMNITQSEE